VRTVAVQRLKTFRVERFVYAEPDEPTAFAPADTTIRLWRLPTAPPQLFVAWTRPDDPRSEKNGRTRTSGVILWRRERFEDGHRWRMIYRRGYPPFANIYAEVGDATGDGAPDVLHYHEQGSGGCGPHYLVAVQDGFGREVFRKNSCESRYRIAAGVLAFDEPVGPCPLASGSAHCFGGSRHVRMRWTGSRLVVGSAQVTCGWPELNLDPANECRRRAR
jgi:hypothetical protein